MHDWMSFASWYTLQKHFPDAEIIIAIERSLPRRDFFSWVGKCKIKRFYYNPPLNKKQFEGEVYFISPTVMAVRDCGDRMGPVSSKSDIQATLVDYSDGCGNFVVSEWINRMDTPFFRATKKFATKDATINEVAVVRLWEKMYSLFCSIKM
jgi:hypothetical protein